MDTPSAEIVKIRDKMVEAIRTMYRRAVEQGLCNVNPTMEIAKIDRGKGGAIPWTVKDLRTYRKRH